MAQNHRMGRRAFRVCLSHPPILQMRSVRPQNQKGPPPGPQSDSGLAGAGARPRAPGPQGPSLALKCKPSCPSTNGAGSCLGPLPLPVLSITQRHKALLGRGSCRETVLLTEPQLAVKGEAGRRQVYSARA